MTKILEGKTLSKRILSSLPARIEKVAKVLGRPPSLAIINYYEDSPSGIYVRIKLRTCEKLGIRAKLIVPDEKTDYGRFKSLLVNLCNDGGIDAIMLERPLPAGFEKTETFDLLCADKDVDCVSALNMGRLFITKKTDEMLSGNRFVPCTAWAVIRLIREHGVEIGGKRIAVLGRSAIVGKPTAHMLSSMDATVTLCHSRTSDIIKILRDSEIIVSAIGKARWLGAEMVKEGATVIDVGTNTDENGKMCGDADYDKILPKAGAITPVPGGVGPVTLACLIESVVMAAEKAAERKNAD